VVHDERESLRITTEEDIDRAAVRQCEGIVGWGHRSTVAAPKPPHATEPGRAPAQDTDAMSSPISRLTAAAVPSPSGSSPMPKKP